MILDAILQDIRVIAIGFEVYQVPVFYSLVIFIEVCRLAIFQFQQSVGAAFYFLTRRSSQTYQQRIEVIKDGAILAKHRTMGLVDDNQVEATYAEFLFLHIDEVDHRLIGREYQACIQIPLLTRVAEVAFGLIWQIGIKLAKSLIYQGGAICKEQHALYPVIP